MDELTFEDVVSDDFEDVGFSDDFVDADGNGFGEDNNEEPQEQPDDEEEIQQEEVQQEEDIEDDEEQNTPAPKEEGLPSSNNDYSSIANALKGAGFFAEIEEEYDIDEEISSIKDADDLYNFFEAFVNTKVSEKVKRVDDALNANVPVDAIKNYENALETLGNISDVKLIEESEEGENLRRNLLTQYYYEMSHDINKARREANKSIDASTDIEDAQDAIKFLKEQYNRNYNALIEEGNKRNEDEISRRRQKADNVYNSIMNDDKLFNTLSISNKQRKLIYDNLSVPIEKDENGEYMTALQKFQREHNEEFLKYTSMFFTITDGFKDFSKIFKSPIKKEIKRNVKHLESLINNTRRDEDGSLMFNSGVSSNSKFKSPFSDGWSLQL